MSGAWALFWRDAWSPIWPNLIASVIWATPAFTIHHVLLRRHITAQLAKQRQDGEQP